MPPKPPSPSSLLEAIKKEIAEYTERGQKYLEALPPNSTITLTLKGKDWGKLEKSELEQFIPKGCSAGGIAQIFTSMLNNVRNNGSCEVIDSDNGTDRIITITKK
jgi:hypothetical protein